MGAPPRVPPRFVPTLTEVVGEPEPELEPPPAHLPQEGGANTEPGAAVPAPSAAAPLGEGFEEYVVHRVMQRVDALLEQRLRQAIAHVTEEQTRSLVPRLREEVESVVRYSVYDAVAQELAGEREIR